MVASKGTIIDEIDQLLKSPLDYVYLLWGNDDFLKSYIINRLSETFEQQKGSRAERWHFYGEIDREDDFFDHLMTGGMFATTKIIVYHNIAKLETKNHKRLLAYLKNPADTILLILTAPADSRPKWLETLSKSAHLRLIRPWTPFPSQYSQVFKQLIRQDGYTLTVEALEMLIDLTNDSLAHTMAEWEKLKLYVGERRNIDIKDVQMVVSGIKEYDIYDLVAAIAKRQKGEAIRIALYLLQRDLSIPLLIIQLYDLFVRVWAKETGERERLYSKKSQQLEAAMQAYAGADFGAIFRALRRTDLMSKTTNLKEELVVPLICEIVG